MDEILERIGLTKKESEIYQVLLCLGESPVADVIRETKYHPQIVYRALDGLIAGGLVFASVRRHRRYVRAEDPSALANIAQKQLSDVRRIIPKLESLQNKPESAMVRVYRGKEGVRFARAKAVDELGIGQSFAIIGGSGDAFYEIMGSELAQVEKKRIKKKITKKMLAYENQRGPLKKYDKFTDFAETRFLPMDFSVPASTLIYADTVIIFIFTADPLTIMIESPEAAQSYRQYFEAMWQLSSSFHQTPGV